MIAFYGPLIVLSILPLLPCQDCRDTVTITPPTYNISSPNYPNNYPNRCDYKWKISVEESSRIQLWFTHFQFEQNDKLQMWDGSDDKADQVFMSCAESLADFKAENNGTASFNSSGNMFYLRMTTNRRVRGRGFLATYISIPEPATTTEATISTSSDAQSTHLKRTTVFALFSTWKTANYPSKRPGATVSTNFSTNVPLTITPTDMSSNPPSSILLVVVPTVSFVLLLACLCVTCLFIHTRRSSGKSNTSSNGSSCQDVRTNPVRTVEELSEPYNKPLYYTNESFHASPQDTYPPYQSKVDMADIRSSRMNTRIFPSEGVIGDVAYESCDGEHKHNGDYTAKAGEVTNIAYESYDGEKIADNGDYASNVGEVGNIAYESYDGQENVDNGDYTANVGEVSNIAYQNYDGQGKVENDDNVLHEGETSNVVYESYDRHEKSSSSDDTAKGEVLNVAYESYDGENNVIYDTDEVSREYQTIDDSQSVDDEYSKIRY